MGRLSFASSCRESRRVYPDAGRVYPDPGRACPELHAAATLPLVSRIAQCAPSHPRRSVSRGTAHRPDRSLPGSGQAKVRPLHNPAASPVAAPLFASHSFTPSSEGPALTCAGLALTQQGPRACPEHPAAASLPRPPLSGFFSPLATRHSFALSLEGLALSCEGPLLLSPCASKFLKIFKNFQANSFVCRVFNFYPGGGGVSNLQTGQALPEDGIGTMGRFKSPAGHRLRLRDFLVRR
jgi:hypothetical protein